MKKLLKLNNLGWIIAGILFLMLAFKTNPENKKIEVETEKVILTETVIPTKSEDLILVTKIIDGDTLMVKINDKEEAIRLIGIDTPETKDTRKTIQCFGKKATERAKELMENKKVRLEADETQEDKDIYNRLLRYIYLEDETLVNKKLIEEGFGFEYTYKIPYKFQTEFKEAQKMAEENKIGLWADDACPIPTVNETITPTIVPVKEIQSSSSFVCNCSKTCSQISSCEEAYFQLNDCGCTIRDNDGDGVPCESLCN